MGNKYYVTIKESFDLSFLSEETLHVLTSEHSSHELSISFKDLEHMQHCYISFYVFLFNNYTKYEDDNILLKFDTLTV